MVAKGQHVTDILWVRPVQASRVAVLLGAFDPPTNAHVGIAKGAGQLLGLPPALCLTTVLLGRTSDELLGMDERLRLLVDVADGEALGLAVANKGTYLEVSRAMRADGIEATFVIGSDKLPQLADPSFYPDGERGVDATFAEVSFAVVPRAGARIEVENVQVLDAADVFDDAELASISATDVRRRIRSGERPDRSVPPAVARALEGYTRADRR